MNVDLKEFENQFLTWKDYWCDRKDLDYLNLDSTAKTDLTHNLKIIAYRVDLGNKAVFALEKQNCIHILDLRTKLQVLEKQFSQINYLSEVVRQQREDLRRLLSRQDKLLEEILHLKQDHLKRRPLTKVDVEELFIKLSKQPKATEQHTSALTEELSKKVDKIEELIHQLRKAILG